MRVSLAALIVVPLLALAAACGSDGESAEPSPTKTGALEEPAVAVSQYQHCGSTRNTNVPSAGVSTSPCTCERYRHWTSR